MAGLFTPTSRAEVTGKEGKPVQVETIVGLVREAALEQQELAPQREDPGVNSV